ncbi:exodeoxyribonuclease VII large subunit [Synoicihabitans lomoniglobus]|uniref:Exodeoxyribonuclease 7 large subunit n=1 Tax=Synoicihabitans lomoniglobus TaxID=2909285 RepID=A0AAF0CIT2_9BACT|nr:exodeoxyribonuclease VII large subunit [Opitutaceae bacterium LMO-M01]WED65747.1 exodeoxyribonuclease VII large subunit [Opitutaceae bacterium LMO-M01]
MADWTDNMERASSVRPETPQAESVTAFTRRVKTLLESTIGGSWVRGEISNLRRQASGHVYFSLKDGGAQLSCVLFRGDAMRQKVELRDGQQVIVGGQISVYEARGQYQLIVRTVVEDGVGRLQREFEALKKRLADEGLFERERKRSLPRLPEVVGFVTSPTGAAVQDFARIMLRRGWRGRLVVLPAKVQGEGAAIEIANMVRTANELGGFDVLVVGRGGGSLEDLWAFNEEKVVRAIADSTVPVISAVGHEIDFTLSDFVADVRAETPSGAAELLSSSHGEMKERVTTAGAALREALGDGVVLARDRLAGVRSRLRLLTPRGQIEQGWLRRDDLANRLGAALQRALVLKQTAWREKRQALASHSPQRRVEFESHRLLALWKRLQAASPESVLKRGFVIMRDDQGRPVLRKASLQPNARYEAEFADGKVELRTQS